MTVLLDALDEESVSNEGDPDASAAGLRGLGGALLVPLSRRPDSQSGSCSAAAPRP